MSTRPTAATILGLLLALASPCLAYAGTFLVSPTGTDSDTCGKKTAPCRTITRAIANAATDDTVLVAPGRYGDADGNGSISGPDDETPSVNGCDCVLDIAKRVTVISRDGAAATVIDGGGAGLNTVRLSADGAVFGKKNKGFTLTGADQLHSALDLATNGATVTGHLFVGNDSSGLSVQGSRNVIASCRFFADGASGLLVSGQDNVISETTVFGATNAAAAGFGIAGERNTLRGVVAIDNYIGINLRGPGHLVTGSVVVRNTLAGISLSGNGDTTIITKTTMHGSGSGSGFFANCGLLLAGIEANGVAIGNYWGAPTGPGPRPADSVCIIANGTATTTPFATKEHKTPTKPLR